MQTRLRIPAAILTAAAAIGLAACGSTHAVSLRALSAQAHSSHQPARSTTTPRTPEQELPPPAATTVNYTGCNAVCWHRLLTPALPHAATAAIRHDCDQARSAIRAATKAAKTDQQIVAAIGTQVGKFANDLREDIRSLPAAPPALRKLSTSATAVAKALHDGPAEAVSIATQTQALATAIYSAGLGLHCYVIPPPKGWNPPPVK